MTEQVGGGHAAVWTGDCENFDPNVTDVCRHACQSCNTFACIVNNFSKWFEFEPKADDVTYPLQNQMQSNADNIWLNMLKGWNEVFTQPYEC